MGCGSTRDDNDIYTSTSQILYDGSGLGCIGVMAGDDLNDVLSAIATYACSIGSIPTKWYANDVYLSAKISYCGLTLPDATSLQNALNLMAAYMCGIETSLIGYIHGSEIANPYSALVSDGTGTPVGVTMAVNTVLGRSSAGAIQDLNASELTTILGITQRDAVNGGVKPITTTDYWIMGDGTTSEKVVLVVDEGEATFLNNPTIGLTHNVSSSGFTFFGTDGDFSHLYLRARNNNATMGAKSVGAGHTTQTQSIVLWDTASNSDPDYYWSFTKDGADSKTLKVQWIVSSPASTSTYMKVTTAGTITFGAGVGFTKVVDEDDMASDSATYLCTQQSIKAYQDNAIGPRTYTSQYYVNDGDPITSSIDALDVELRRVDDKESEVTLVIAHADIQQLNSSPKTLISALGLGKAPEIISISFTFRGGVTPYATNTNVRIYQTGATEMLCTNDQILLSSVVRTIFGEKTIITASAVDTQMLANTAVMIDVETGDPTAGAAGQELVIHVRYRTLNIV